MYLLKNSKIISEDGILEGYEILIKDDIIVKIEKSEAIEKYIDIDNIEVLDVKGNYIVPGIIDVHSDYIEGIVAPRPTSLMNFDLSIIEAEKIILNSGITTMYHSLAIFDDIVECKEIRKGKNVQKLINIIDSYRKNKTLVRHRIHARFELDCIKELQMLEELIDNDKVDLVSFMDHSPGQGQYKNIEIYKNIIQQYKNCSEKEAEKLIDIQMNKDVLKLESLEGVIKKCRKKGIKLASHDDDSKQKINLIDSLGIKISEFPINYSAAIHAKEKGMKTVGGAANVLLGGSHSGNISMAEAILEGVIDVLCSDYYPQALLQAPFLLSEKYNLDLCEMFKLVTLNPAKMLGIDNTYGSIKEGKKADLLIVKKDEFAVINKVFVDGNIKLEIAY